MKTTLEWASIIFKVIIIACSFIIMIAPFYSHRRRGVWARIFMVFGGFLCIICYGFKLALATHWLSLGKYNANLILLALNILGDLLLGGFIALLFTGQALGKPPVK